MHIMDPKHLRSSEVDRYLDSDFEFDSENNSDESVEDIIVQHGECNTRPIDFLEFIPSSSKSKCRQSQSECRISPELLEDFEENSEVSLTNNGSPKPIEDMDFNSVPSTSTDTSMESRPRPSTSEPNIETNPKQNLPTKVLFLEKPIKKSLVPKKQKPGRPKKSATVRSS